MPSKHKQNVNDIHVYINTAERQFSSKGLMYFIEQLCTCTHNPHKEVIVRGKYQWYLAQHIFQFLLEFMQVDSAFEYLQQSFYYSLIIPCTIVTGRCIEIINNVVVMIACSNQTRYDVKNKYPVDSQQRICGFETKYI